MSAAGRPNPLDRLGPVDMPVRPCDGESAREPESSEGVGNGSGAGPADEADHPGWGIGAMPTWLAPEPGREDRSTHHRSEGPRSAEPARGGFGRRRSRFDDVLDADDEEREGFWDDEDPVPRRRFAIAPPGALALIAVGVIACAVAAFGLFRGSDPAPVVDFGAPAGGSASAAPGATTVPGATTEPSGPSSPQPGTTPGEIVVSVVGLVNDAGLVRLPSGARVADAIEKAGGTRKDADLLSLNLAQVLRDGDQILVGYAGGQGQMSLKSAVVGASGSSGGSTEPAGAPDGPAAEAGSRDGGGKVNLNTATEAELDTLPGIGPVTAKAIIDWRQRNGRFTSVDQLAEVDGIGAARLAKLRDRVTV
nr:ComEA family DNA-binding protein [Gordonia paraffinivorans]